MSGNRIGIEGIQHQQIERSIWRPFNGQTTVPNFDVAVSSAIRQECEEVAGDVVYLRINIKKRNMPVRSRPPGHAPRAQSDDSNALVAPLAEHFHDIADGSSLVIVRKWLANQTGVQALDAMQCIAMQ